MLEITRTAAAAIRDVIAGADKDVIGLRIEVLSGGCAGIRYELCLDTTAQDDDDVLDCGGAKILIDADSAPLLEGATVDFRNDLPEAGFVFDNPNAAGLCSCAGGSCSENEGVQ